MKKYIPIDALTPFIEKRKIEVFLDKVNFKTLFIFWILLILLMGFGYHFWSTETSYLAYSKNNLQPSLADSIYFSFITATSTGFGDVVPNGFFKVMSIFEVIISLTLFAVVTSKLIGLKQETILSEIYEISFSEKLNRIRSSLYLFRIDLNKVMFKVEEEKLKKREVSELWTFFSHFENTISEISVLVGTQKDRDFIKRIDTVDLELLLNGINSSLERIKDTIITLNESKYEWKRDVTLSIIQKSLEKTAKLFSNIGKLYDKKEITSIQEDFNKFKKEILSELVDVEKI